MPAPQTLEQESHRKAPETDRWQPESFRRGYMRQELPSSTHFWILADDYRVAIRIQVGQRIRTIGPLRLASRESQGGDEACVNFGHHGCRQAAGSREGSPLCSIVKRLLHETSDGPWSRDGAPSGAVGSMRRCLGSPSILRLPVIKATTVFRLRALSASFCTTRAGLELGHPLVSEGELEDYHIPRWIMAGSPGSYPTRDLSRPRPSSRIRRGSRPG